MGSQDVLRGAKSPRVVVNVTEHEITESTRADSGHCMVAEAVKRAVPWARHVSVDLQTIRFTDPTLGVRYVYLTPRSPQDALLRYDHGDAAIAPFSFILRNAMVAKANIKDPATGERPAVGKPRLAKHPKDSKVEAEEGRGHVPIRVGGLPPAAGVLASNRRGMARAFGLRLTEPTPKEESTS